MWGKRVQVGIGVVWGKRSANIRQQVAGFQPSVPFNRRLNVQQSSGKITAKLHADNTSLWEGERGGGGGALAQCDTRTESGQLEMWYPNFFIWNEVELQVIFLSVFYLSPSRLYKICVNLFFLYNIVLQVL